jgi:hypothetical protein
MANGNSLYLKPTICFSDVKHNFCLCGAPEAMPVRRLCRANSELNIRDRQGRRLEYPWSGFRWYPAAPGRRPGWMRVDRLLNEHDTGRLRRQSAEAKAERIIGAGLKRLRWKEDDLKLIVWRLNLFRADCAQHAFLAWNPTLVGTAHAPERFGLLEFVE